LYEMKKRFEVNLHDETVKIDDEVLRSEKVQCVERELELLKAKLLLFSSRKFTYVINKLNTLDHF
jgi:hypothetical protein